MGLYERAQRHFLTVRSYLMKYLYQEPSILSRLSRVQTFESQTFESQVLFPKPKSYLGETNILFGL